MNEEACPPPKLEVTEAYASVRIYGERLDPLDVTLALRLPADHTHRRGEPRLRRLKSRGLWEGSPYRDGMWSVSSKQWVESPRLSSHVEWLLGEFEPKAAQLAAVLGEGIEADIFCYFYGPMANPPSLPQSLHERAAALGLVIEIDHYQESPADESPA